MYKLGLFCGDRHRLTVDVVMFAITISVSAQYDNLIN